MVYELLRPRTPTSHLLGFNAHYIYDLGGREFMDGDEITDWIDSVSSYLQDWYDHCLSKPENQHHLQRVINNIEAFITDMHHATDEQHRIAIQANKVVTCPSNQLLHAKHAGLLGFRHYSAATVCLIARYGTRYGQFAECHDEGGWHLAATMLLITVIVDLKDGDYFASQFKKNAQAKAQASKKAKADSAVAALAQQLHELTMQSGNGFKPEDEQMEAMRLGLSSINLAK
jgi:hypothetical protein